MKPLSETYKEMGIAFSFPIKVKDKNGNLSYYEDMNHWCRWEHDHNGRVTFNEESGGAWFKAEWDENNTCTYYEDHAGVKVGTPRSAKTHEGKVIKIDGVEYELKAR